MTTTNNTYYLNPQYIEHELEQTKQEIKQIYDVIKRCIPVNTVHGKKGNIIGLTYFDDDKFIELEYKEQDDTSVVKVTSGMVVLFSSKPQSGKLIYLGPQPGKLIYLTDYQLRKSKNTGKFYIKCFSWITNDQYNELKQRLQLLQDKQRELHDLQEKAELINTLTKLYTKITGKDRVNERFIEIMMRLITIGDTSEREMIATMLQNISGKTILTSFNTYIILLDNEQCLITELTKYYSYIKECKYPCGDIIPYQIYSDSCEMFTEDNVFEAFECYEIANAIYQKHKVPVFYTTPDSGGFGELTIVLPKDSELLKKLKVTKNSNIDRKLKMLIYCEVLGIDLKEVPEVNKYV